MERGLQECREGLASVQAHAAHAGTCQEHAREVEQTLGELRSKMSDV